jgi:hypothetical protein
MRPNYTSNKCGNAYPFFSKSDSIAERYPFLWTPGPIDKQKEKKKQENPYQHETSKEFTRHNNGRGDYMSIIDCQNACLI